MFRPGQIINASQLLKYFKKIAAYLERDGEPVLVTCKDGTSTSSNKFFHLAETACQLRRNISFLKNLRFYPFFLDEVLVVILPPSGRRVPPVPGLM